MDGSMKARAGCVVAYADSQDPSEKQLPLSGLARIADSVAGVFTLWLGLAVLVRYNGLFPSVIDWDVSLYAVMAQQWLHGGLPYQTVWDQHPVGLPALFAAILYVFPQSMIALRLSACVAVAMTATAIFFIARRIERGFVAPIAAAILYIAWTARLWGLSGNTEIYLNAFVAMAMLLLLRVIDGPWRGRRSVADLCLGGLLLGMALEVKHVALAETGLFVGVVCALSLHLRAARAMQVLALTSAAILLPTVIVTAYFCLNGLAAEYFHAVVGANLVYVTDRPSLAYVLAHVPRSFIIPIGAIALGTVVAWRRGDRRTALVVAWAAAALIDVALPGKFFPHYFLLMMAPAALLAGHVAAALRDVLGRQRPLAAVTASVVVLLACNPVGVYADSMKARGFRQHDAPAMVAGVIGEGLKPGESIFVFNYQPVVYFLTGAELPTRHVLPADWSWRYTAVTRVDPLKELDSVFRTRPQYVVFLDNDWAKMGNRVLQSLHQHLAWYAKEAEVLDTQILPQPVMVEIYRRRTDTSVVNEP